MIISLTLVRYRRIYIPMALIAMAIHRIPLWINRKCSFWKLMGSGMRGSFDLRPDLQQWALLGVWSSEADFFRFYERSFISSWWKFFGCEKWTILCRPISSHGQWDGRNPFSSPSTEYLQEEPVAVLTRATIRWRRLGNFWSHVEEVSAEMAASEGYICSFGVGEVPLYRQATFSVWRSTAHMQ